MKDNNRNALRAVLKPSAYPMVLLTPFACYCSSCAANHIYELINDLRHGYADNYSAFCTANTDHPITCEVCNERVTWLDDLSMDPAQAEMLEASESLYCSDSDL
jgi:hypothetical protein